MLFYLYHSAVSTFWIANPNNNIINCSAAGSEVSISVKALGFFFLLSAQFNHTMEYKGTIPKVN